MIHPFYNDLVIDLGSAFTRIGMKGSDETVREPSAVACSGREIVAVGGEALRLTAQDPGNLQLVRPVFGGAVSDIRLASGMIAGFLSRFRKARFRFLRKAVILGTKDLSELEKRAMEQTLKNTGAYEVVFADAGRAAALGCGLPIGGPQGSMVMDIGAGKTEVTVWSMDSCIASASIRSGAEDWRRSIIAYMKNEYQVMIHEKTADELMTLLADVYAAPEGEAHPVRARDCASGLPVTISVSATEISEVLRGNLSVTAGTAESAFQRTLPELASDVYQNGLVVCGGGSCLRGLPEWMERRFSFPVRRAEDPSEAVFRGGQILINRRKTSKINVNWSGRNGSTHA